MKIGIPRGLLYYYFFPFWKTFFQELGLEVVVSDTATKKTLTAGNRYAVDDMCLPVKLYLGHVDNLSGRTDYIFLPRYLGLGKRNKICPKLMGLPDVVTSKMNGKLPATLVPDINLCSGLVSLRKIYLQLGKKLNKNILKREVAFWKAYHQQLVFKRLQKKGFTAREGIKAINDKIKAINNNKDKSAIMNKVDSKESAPGRSNLSEKSSLKFKQKTDKKGQHTNNRTITLAVLGHSYITNDEFLNLGLFELLEDMGVSLITQNMLSSKLLEKAAGKHSQKKIYWCFNRQVMGAAYYFLYEQSQKIDGLLHVSSFGCGPDALTGELLELKARKREGISLLNINLDEHSGRAGLKTRLEAFIDLLERRKHHASGNLPAYG